MIPSLLDLLIYLTSNFEKAGERSQDDGLEERKEIFFWIKVKNLRHRGEFWEEALIFAFKIPDMEDEAVVQIVQTIADLK